MGMVMGPEGEIDRTWSPWELFLSRMYLAPTPRERENGGTLYKIAGLSQPKRVAGLPRLGSEASNLV